MKGRDCWRERNCWRIPELEEGTIGERAIVEKRGTVEEKRGYI